MLELAFLLATTWLHTSWSSEPACVEADSIAERVERLLGEERVPPATRLGLSAARSGDAWTIGIDLQAEGVELKRELRGDDCEVLTEALALVIAVRLDPVAVAAVVEPVIAPAEAPSEIPEPVVVPSEPARVGEAEGPPRPPPLPRARPRALLGASVAGEIGIFPRSAATFELDVGVTWRHARFELAGLSSIGPDARPVDGVGARFRLFAAVARGCGVIVRDEIEFPICGAFEIGELWARGTGLRSPETVHALWLAPVVGLRPRWTPLPRLALGVIIDVVIPINRHRFTTPDSRFEHQVAPVAGRLGLGAEIRLP